VVRGGNRKEESQRVKKQIVKRSLDHEQTQGAKDERRHRLEELAKKGVPVFGKHYAKKRDFDF